MHLLFLPVDPAADALLLHVDGDGRLLERRTLRDDGPAADAAAPRIPATVVVPGTEVRAVWLSLPSRHHGQALAAARLALEDHVAGDLAAMHVALDRAADPTQPRCVLVAAHAAMQAWLARCDRLGVRAAALVPDYLLLPPPGNDDVLHVAEWQGDALARGRMQGFRVEPGLLAVVAGPQARHAVVDSGTSIETVFARQAATASPDLLQGPYARHDGHAARRGKRLLLLAVLVLASPALVDGAIALRHAVAAHLLHSRATELLATQGHAQPPGTDAAAAIEALALQATWPDTLAGRIGALSEAVSQAPGARLDAITLARGGRAQVGLQHRDAGALDAIRAHLGNAGLDAVVLDTQPLGDGWRSELSLEARQ